MVNTRILTKGVSRSVGYTYRKRLSVAVAPKMFAPADVRRMRAIFGDKQDDAVEAAIIAVHAYYEHKTRRAAGQRPAQRPAVLAMSAPMAFTSPAQIALTPEERHAVLADMPIGEPKPARVARKRAAPKGAPRKRARAASP